MEIVAAISVIMGFVSALIIAIDLRRHSQKMKIMNSVWILTALWGGVVALCAYFWFGRQVSKKMYESEMGPQSTMMSMPEDSLPMNKMSMTQHPYWQSVTLSTLHCGAGCSLADLIGEWFLYFVTITIAGSTLLGSVVVDYFLALFIGIYFQYMAIRSMLPINYKPIKIITNAFKADVLSLTSWQIGMYSFMAIALFLIFPNHNIDRVSWIFWFMMQIAMFMGFLICFPINMLLIKLGIKKAM